MSDDVTVPPCSVTCVSHGVAGVRCLPALQLQLPGVGIDLNTPTLFRWSRSGLP